MSTKSSDQMAGDSLEHGDDQKEGGGGGHENRVNKVGCLIFTTYIYTLGISPSLVSGYREGYSFWSTWGPYI